VSTCDKEDQLDPNDPTVMDLGHGVLAKFYVSHGRLELGHVGVLYEHPDGKGGRCWGGVPFAGKNPADPRGWQLESLEPLTLSPSVLCMSCQHHGFIRGGKWVPA
jgi:hypothetical protein